MKNYTINLGNVEVSIVVEVNWKGDVKLKAYRPDHQRIGKPVLWMEQEVHVIGDKIVECVERAKNKLIDNLKKDIEDFSVNIDNQGSRKGLKEQLEFILDFHTK